MVVEAMNPTYLCAPPQVWQTSVEFGHFYLYPPASSRLRSGLREAHRTAVEAGRLLAGLVAAGMAARTVLMVDDVAGKHLYTDGDIRSIASQWPVQPDDIARESAMIPVVQREMPDTPLDCHHLTLAWYLCRLGVVEGPVHAVAHTIYTVLPARYMALEAEVHRELRQTYHVPHERMRWTFV